MAITLTGRTWSISSTGAVSTGHTRVKWIRMLATADGATFTLSSNPPNTIGPSSRKLILTGKVKDFGVEAERMYPGFNTHGLYITTLTNCTLQIRI